MFIAGRVVVKRYIFLFFSGLTTGSQRGRSARGALLNCLPRGVSSRLLKLSLDAFGGAPVEIDNTQSDREREKRPFLVRTGKRPFGMNEEEEEKEE